MGLTEYFGLFNPAEPGLPYPVGYDPLLVALSVGIAVFAAYAALDVSEQVAATPPGGRRMRWLAMGGLAMGAGVWAMHFLGMLALALPCEVQYDLSASAASMLPAAAAGTFALAAISRRQISMPRLLWAGTLLGTGVGTMHCAGMAALRVDAQVRYDAKLFLLALAVAVALACIALLVKFRLAGGKAASSLRAKLAGAAVMGLAMAGMHYTAMAAAHFIPNGHPAAPPTVLHKETLAGPVLVLSALLLAVATAASAARRLRDAAWRYRLVADHTYAWETWLDGDGRYLYASPSALPITGYAAEAFVEDPGLLLRIIHPDDREKFADHHRRPGGEVHGLTFRVLHKDGHVVWLEHSCRAVYADDGRYLGRRGSSHDITTRKLAEDRLRKLSLAVEQNPCSIVMTDRDAVVEYVNERFTRETGFTREEMVGQNPRILHSGLTDPGVYDGLWETLARGEPWQGEFFNKRKDGSVYVERAFIAPLTGEDGQVSNYVGIKLNITEQKRAEERLRLAAGVFENALEGIVITDPQCRIVDVNSAYCHITGYRREELVGQNPKLLKSGRQGPAFYADMWKAIGERGQWRGEIWNRRKSGEVYAEKLSISAVRDEQGAISHYVGVMSDITQAKESQVRLERLAHYDPLTRLPNRMLLADRMRQAMALALRNDQLLAVCYLDLDGFKPVNDRHGHDAGDHLLIEVAGRLQDALRTTDTVARLGGDEFAVLLGGLNSIGECESAIARLLEAVARPCRLPDGQEAAVTASLGFTAYPLDDADADSLLRHADQAMYQAKQIGRNRHCAFDPVQDRQARNQWIVRARLEEALRQGEFELHYQPKVNMRLGAVAGFEALIRWREAEHGLMLPDDFLPLIEESELSVEVGLWVIRRALRQLAEWNRQGHMLCVSVNVSARHVRRPDFARQVRQLLEEFPDVAPPQLGFEVLESAALAEAGHISAVIGECQDMGVAFALDAFGTGYASLSHLRRLPAKILKIDRSFVREMLNDRDGLAIVDGIVALANTFGRAVVAEGVETEEQGRALMRLGCDTLQGYLIAKPMPAEEVPGWLAAYRPSPAWRQAEQQQGPRLFAYNAAGNGAQDTRGGHGPESDG